MDQELRDLFKDIAERHKETDKLIKETSEQQKKTDEQMKKTDAKLDKLTERYSQISTNQEKTDEQQKKTDEQMKKTDARLDKLAKIYGGVSQNQGDAVEEFFFNTLKGKKRIGNMVFDTIQKNMRVDGKNLKGEYDIVLYNGSSVAIIETKYKAHIIDIENLREKKIPNFRKLFPFFDNYKIFAGIAGFHINDDVVKKAEEYGFFVLKRKGKIVEFDTDFVKEQLAG